MSAFASKHRPRLAPLVVLGVVAAYFVLLVGLGGYHNWDELGVPARGELTFLDLRSVTTGWECTRRGIDVLPRNPCDPLGRPANYPRIWMAPAFLGLGDGSTVPLGLTICAIFFLAAAFVLPEGTTPGEAVLYSLAMCSPAVMLGIARANVDILLFALVAAALRWRRRGRYPLYAGGLLLWAAILKLYPVFAAPALLLRRTRSATVASAAVVSGFAVYALITLPDIETIRRVVPQVDGYSYGLRIFCDWIASGPTGLSPSEWQAILALTAGALAVVAQPRVSRSPIVRSAKSDSGIELFAAGACIYVCTYVFFRSWDYRLCFLLLCIPQLLRWTRRGSVLALIALIALFATLWLGTPWGGVPAIYDLLQRLEMAISYHTPFQRMLLSPATIAQFMLFASLLPAVLATLAQLRPTTKRASFDPVSSQALRQNTGRNPIAS